jgi:phosphate starvation-inducible PhoH-like protein
MPLPQSAELFFGLRLTDEQKVYADSGFDNLFTGCHAVSGSGKTTVATGVAKLLGKELHYIFPTVEEKALGFSTGDIKAKESKYLTPLYDALLEIGENPMRAIFTQVHEEKQDEILELKIEKQRKKNKYKIKNPVYVPKEGDPWVHAYSHNYMRGSNLKDCVVIIDEAQNLTKRELRKILTRCHDSCHVFLIGDPNQCDIDPKKSGFMPYLMHYEGQSFAKICTLTNNFRGRLSAWAEELKA